MMHRQYTCDVKYTPHAMMMNKDDYIIVDVRVCDHLGQQTLHLGNHDTFVHTIAGAQACYQLECGHEAREDVRTHGVHHEN